jgi:hypothetical protein
VSDPTQTEYGASRRPSANPLRRIAAAVCAVEALTLLGFCMFYLWELGQGASADATRAVVSAILIAVVAVGLAVLARSWWRGAGWPNTPTVVWNLLLLPVAWSLVQAGHLLIAVAVGVVALVGVVAAIGARSQTTLE